MTHNKFITSTAVTLASAALLTGLAVLPASADVLGTNAALQVSASAAAGSTSVSGSDSTSLQSSVSGLLKSKDRAALTTASLSTIQTRGDSETTARIDALNKLQTRIGQMQRLSATEKSTLSAEINTQIDNMTSIKAKIDADTDVTTARADAKSVLDSYRIFALILPQGEIVAASDRVTTVTGLMATISAKFQVRINAAQSAGKDVSALQAAFSDMNAKVADANAQASTANSAVISLSPDQGNATVAASNKAALEGARADIKTATADLVAARKDAGVILKGLESVNVTATTTVSQ